MAVSRLDRLREREAMLAGKLAATRAEIAEELQLRDLRATQRLEAAAEREELLVAQVKRARIQRNEKLEAKRRANRQALRAAATVVAIAAGEHFGRTFSSAAILERGRTARVVAARVALVTIGRERFGMTFAEIAAVMGRSELSSNRMCLRELTDDEKAIYALALGKLDATAEPEQDRRAS
jgi:hypothetical protein